MIKLYGIKNCDSVKKAIKYLKAHELEFKLIDFKIIPVDCDTIKPWLNDIDMKLLFNTRGTTYRTLQLKTLDLDDAQKLEWLCKENLLIKRPVLEYDGHFHVAFNEENYNKIFN